MISVVMASYNASNYIGAAIESILNQTYKEFELIIVDDGSTDNTIEIVNRYTQQDNRILLFQAEHGGPSRARNIAIKASKHPWIAILDADDIALPQRLEKQINAATANPKVVAWGTAVHHINSKGEIISVGRHGPQTEEQFYQMRQEGHLVALYHPTALLKKEIVLKVGGYNPEFPAAQDLELFDQIAEYGPILGLTEPLVLYRVHSQSISMKRFFLQKQLGRYIRARHLARLAQKEEPTLDEFIAERQQRPWFTRFKDRFKTYGSFYYRKAGLLVCEKQYLQAGYYLSLSFLLNPQYSIGRVRRQVFSSKSRKLLQKSRTDIAEP